MDVNRSYHPSPMVPGFEWVDGPIGPVLQAQALNGLADHAVTSCHLRFRGESVPADTARLARLFGALPSAVVSVSQVHGREVLVVDRRHQPRPAEADAVITTDPDVVLTVRVADCVPILIADHARGAVAVVHAGWRGTAAGVTRATVEALARLGVSSSALVAVIGPSIGPCCYEVREDVRSAMRDAQPQADQWFSEAGSGRWILNLWRAAEDQLVAAGLRVEAVHTSKICTAGNPAHCHSHRRDAEGAGRMVAAIRLRPQT